MPPPESLQTPDDVDRTGLTRTELETEEALRQTEADARGWRVVFTEVPQQDGRWTLQVRYDWAATDAQEQPAAPDFTLPTPPQAAPAGGALPPIVAGRTLAQLAQDYTLSWAACVIDPARKNDVAAATDRMVRGRTRYATVQARTGAPWQLIGIMHGLECGYSFLKHLHNGDPLSAPTVRVPAGHPPGWTGAGTWEDSAVDAVSFRFRHVAEWKVPQMLYALEGFNGFGYRSFGVRSPYLWSFSNLYTKGRYVADHVYDANAVSKQVGAALILKTLEQEGQWP